MINYDNCQLSEPYKKADGKILTKEECTKIYKFVDELVKPNIRHWYVGDMAITGKGKLMDDLRKWLYKRIEKKEK